MAAERSILGAALREPKPIFIPAGKLTEVGFGMRDLKLKNRKFDDVEPAYVSVREGGVLKGMGLVLTKPGDCEVSTSAQAAEFRQAMMKQFGLREITANETVD